MEITSGKNDVSLKKKEVFVNRSRVVVQIVSLRHRLPGQITVQLYVFAMKIAYLYEE